MTSSGTRGPQTVRRERRPADSRRRRSWPSRSGTVRDVRDRRRRRSTRGDGLSLAEPVTGTMRLTRTNRGLVVDARADHRPRRGMRRCLRPVVTPVEDPDRRGGAPVHRHRQRHDRPARGRRGPRGAAPDRPPRAGAATARRSRRSTSRSRSPRCASPTARACARSAASALEPGHRARRTRHRPAPRGAAGLPGRRLATRAGRLPARPRTQRSRVRVPCARTGSITDRGGRAA